MRGRDRGDDRQPEAGAPVSTAAGLVGAVEALEHPLGLLGRQPGAPVTHLHAGEGVAVSRSRADGHRDRRPGGGVTQRVVEQVGYHLPEAGFVTGDDERDALASALTVVVVVAAVAAVACAAA